MTAFTKSTVEEFNDNSLTNECMVKYYMLGKPDSTGVAGSDTITIDKYEGVTAYKAEVLSRTHTLLTPQTATISGNTVTINGSVAGLGYTVVRVIFGKE